jgi:hypothetical protein
VRDARGPWCVEGVGFLPLRLKLYSNLEHVHFFIHKGTWVKMAGRSKDNS